MCLHASTQFVTRSLGSKIIIFSNSTKIDLPRRSTALSRGPGIGGAPQGNSEPQRIGDRLVVGRLHALFMPIARTLIVMTSSKREEQE
jgi:hypothetical protein